MNYPLPHTHATALTGSGTSLLNDWRIVAEHLAAVLDALRDCRPHGRDYMNSREEYSAARSEHYELERHIEFVEDFANIMVNHLNR